MSCPANLLTRPRGPIALKDALENGGWNGALVYVAANADEIAANADTFVAAIEAILAQQINAGALIFLPSGRIEDIRPTGNDWIPLSRFGGQITPNAIFDITLTGQPDVPGVEAVFQLERGAQCSGGVRQRLYPVHPRQTPARRSSWAARKPLIKRHRPR